MKVSLGLSAGFHDSACALVSIGGEVLYASSEERFSRIKGDYSFPHNSIKQALCFASSKSLDIDKIIIHENIIDQAGGSIINLFKHPRAFLDSYTKAKERSTEINNLAKKLCLNPEDILFSDHHLSHAYASIGTSSYKDGLVLVLDAIGQRSAGLIATVKNGTINTKEQIPISKSLGLIYSCVTVYCGFKVLTGEYKLMGLAPYGNPVYLEELNSVFGSPEKHIYSINDLNIYSDRLFSPILERHLGFSLREPSDPLLQKYADLAASVQLYLEKAVCSYIDHAIREMHLNPNTTLFLGGGIALNCKLNLVISEKYKDFFGEIWCFPAAGDSGSAVGACYNYNFTKGYNVQKVGNLHSSQFEHCYLGPEYLAKDIKTTLESSTFKYTNFNSDESKLVISKLISGEVGAIFEGRSEFGPRALGKRSIIGNPCSENTLIHINRHIKSREDFRPLAPIILEEYVEDFFVLNSNAINLSEYMLVLARCKEEIPLRERMDSEAHLVPKSSNHSAIPAVVHLDGTARLQIIRRSNSSLIRRILEDFYKETSTPMLINTSFNVRGEPIVESLDDAINCFKTANLSFLIIDNLVIFRDQQSPLTLLGGTSKLDED